MPTPATFQKNIGAVIGSGGATIKLIREQSTATVNIPDPETNPGPDTPRQIALSGTPAAICAAQAMIVATLAPLGDDSAVSGPANAGEVPVGTRSERNVLWVLESMVGAVIGHKHSTARAIQDSTGCKLHIETRTEKADRAGDSSEVGGNGDSTTADERQVVIMGPPEVQYKAQLAIYHRLVEDDGRRGNSRERRIKLEYPVPNGTVGRVIGKGGTMLQTIATTSGARMRVLRTSFDDEGDSAVELFGRFTEVQAAQNLIRQIRLKNETAAGGH